MKSHTYQRSQMPFSHCYHPGYEAVPPQIKVNPSKSLYDHEQPWPYVGSYGNLTPVHFCRGHDSFPGYYSYRPAYHHAPAPSPVYYSASCPAYFEPFSVPYSLPPCYNMELPRYESDIYVPTNNHCCRCPNNPCRREGEKIEEQKPAVEGKVDNTLAPIELENYPYPYMLKSPVRVEVGEQGHIYWRDRKPSSPGYFRGDALEPKIWNRWFPFDINGFRNMIHDGNGRRNQNWQTDNNKRESEDGKTNHNQHGKNKRMESLLPIMWMPYYNKLENEGRTNNQESTSTPKSIEEVSHIFKSVPANSCAVENITEGTRAYRHLTTNTSSLGVTENIINEKDITVKQMELCERKNDSEGSDRREGNISVKQKMDETTTDEDSQTGVKIQSTSPRKIFKSPTVCLRSWTNGDEYEIKENNIEKKAENIVEVQAIEPREERNSVKLTDDEYRKERKVLPDEAAVLIQAAYRGFKERKGEPLKKLKQMAEVGKQVTDVSGRVQALEASSNLQNDDKHIIIIEEAIMRLLLKLDTIEGLRPSLREIRKSLARELTSLQERLDSILAKKSQQRKQELFAMKVADDTLLNTQNGEFVQDQEEEKVAALREGSSEGISHRSYRVLEQYQDRLSIKDGMHSLPADDGGSESPSPLDSTSNAGTDPIVLPKKIVNKDVNQVVTDNACPSESDLSETEKMAVEHETKLEVECHLIEVGDEAVHGNACLEVNDAKNMQPGVVEFGVTMGAHVPFNDFQKEEEPEEKVAVGEKSEVSAASPSSEELPVIEHKGGLNVNEKLVEENKKLREIMHKLLEAGNEQLTVISDLTDRVKGLEKKLARSKKVRTKAKRCRLLTSKSSNNPLQRRVVGVAM